MHSQYILDDVSGFDFQEIVLSEDNAKAQEILAKLSATYFLHPLTIEDCLHQNQRAKIEAFDQYIFIVWYYICPLSSAIVELHIIANPRHLLLITTNPSPKNGTWKNVFFPGGTLPTRLSSALLKILETSIDHAEQYLEIVTEVANKVEHEIVEEYIKPTEILKLKRYFRLLDHSLLGVQQIFSQLEIYLPQLRDVRFEYRNILDHILRLLERMAQTRSQLNVLMDVYWGAAGLRTNLYMQKLSAVATLFVPLSLWTGFFGMNFEYMPFKEEWFFYFGMILMFASFVVLVIYMISRGILLRRRPPKTHTLFETAAKNQQSKRIRSWKYMLRTKNADENFL